MTKIHVLTLFPEMLDVGLNHSVIGRARENGIIEINAVNIRDYTIDRHKKVDDYPYGGGAGMLIQAQPVYDAWEAVSNGRTDIPVIYATPQGAAFSQRMAEDFSVKSELIFLCGHYEGIDERVIQKIVTHNVSIGDYVLTGGELPVMVMIDALSRLIKGTLHNDESPVNESFSNGLLECPQYTRPDEWRGMKVPEVLLSGHHANIEKWRAAESLKRTKERRPDLM